MQIGLPFARVPTSGDTVVVVAGHPVPAIFAKHRRARHYILRVAADGTLRVTMPWRGSRAEAERFVRERHEWIARERYARSIETGLLGSWTDGTAITLHGVDVTLQVTPIDDRRARVSFGDHAMTVRHDSSADLRPQVERHLRRMAERDLPERLRVLAACHGVRVVGISVRAQRTRWGSCSPSGRISLNWRLIQLPPTVSDYVLLHELAHIRHLNHSARFWREVDTYCPWHREARAWLRGNARLHAFGM